MGTRKLNIASVSGLPSSKRLAKSLEEFGFPQEGIFGIADQAVHAESVTATIVHRSKQLIRRANAKSRMIDTEQIERIAVYPTFFHPGKGILETYEGSGNGIDRLQAFLSSCLGIPAVIRRVELSVAEAVQRLASTAERFQLRMVRLQKYAHSSFVEGSLVARFMDSDHGLDFIREHSEALTWASVRFFANSERVSLHLTSQASFSYSCNDENVASVRSILRKLISLS